jgi:hypothetical protein
MSKIMKLTFYNITDDSKVIQYFDIVVKAFKMINKVFLVTFLLYCF